MDPARNRNSKWFRIAALVLATPGCYLAYLLGIALGPARTHSEGAQTPPAAIRLANGLEVQTAELDLGEVWEDPAYIRPVTIANRGNSEAVITNLSGGCECTAIEPHAFALPPGQSKQVNVKIDLTHRFPHQFGVDRRELALQITPTLAHRGLSAESWKVVGVINSRVSLESRGLAFADLCGQGGPPVTRKMRATTHVPLADIEAVVSLAGRASDGVDKVEVRPVPGQPDKHDILVTPNPDRPLGAFKFDVALTATSPDGVRSACASFYVEGEIVSPVRVIPSPVLLGEHPVGTKAEAVISVKFPAPGWKVERVETESADTIVLPIEPFGECLAYRVSHVIGRAGNSGCQIRLICSKPSGQVETIHLLLHYFGEAKR